MTSPAFREYWREQADLRYAGFWPRTLALFVDILVWLPMVGVFWLVRTTRTGLIAGEMASWVFAVAYPVLMHGYFG